jgi:predicted nucleic acid-binding protein
MKYLVDTCGWIEWLTDGMLADSFAPYLRQPEELLVPTILQYELYRWVCREKDEETALEIIGITEQGCVVALDTRLALLAADLAAQFKLAAMDALIYNTARQAGVELVTSDRHFEGLPGVRYFPKTSG